MWGPACSQLPPTASWPSHNTRGAAAAATGAAQPITMLLPVLTVGEQFAESAEVNGVAANVRRNQDRIELWTRTASNEAAQMKVSASTLPEQL